MTILQSIILGIVQGLTEFLPISSSAHLVIVPYLLRWEIPASEAFRFNVLVQVATLVGVIAYFWGDLIQIGRAFLRESLLWLSQVGKTDPPFKLPFTDPQARQGWYLILATIPAGVIGLILKNSVEQAFSNPLVSSCFLFITAGLLLAAEKYGKDRRLVENMTAKDALWIGLFQAIAIFPGISRSGATTAGGMLRDFERPSAARFSFLMSIPIMLGAGSVAALDFVEYTGGMNSLPVFIPGFIASAVVGYLSIRWLLAFLARHSLRGFALYCVALGLVTLSFYLLGPI